MNSKAEERLLRKLISELDNKSHRPRGGGLALSLVLWMAVFGVMLVFFRYGQPMHWTDALLGVACLGFGFLFAYDIYRSMYAQQWPIISRHLDRSKIEERIHELGA
jgi:hypothetical protein